MNKNFKYIFLNKTSKHQSVIKLVNAALKEKDIKYKFKELIDYNITLNGKKAPVVYQIKKT
tara:strand:+ start:877 stop:1059 length:183 start_codon:yes stop_codon:yes gene_type:complete